jgi:hypothetical protein
MPAKYDIAVETLLIQSIYPYTKAKSRVWFDGWPTIVFSGWPDVLMELLWQNCRYRKTHMTTENTES